MTPDSIPRFKGQSRAKQTFLSNILRNGDDWLLKPISGLVCVCIDWQLVSGKWPRLRILLWMCSTSASENTVNWFWIPHETNWVKKSQLYTRPWHDCQECSGRDAQVNARAAQDRTHHTRTREGKYFLILSASSHAEVIFFLLHFLSFFLFLLFVKLYFKVQFPWVG